MNESIESSELWRFKKGLNKSLNIKTAEETFHLIMKKVIIF